MSVMLTSLYKPMIHRYSLDTLGNRNKICDICSRKVYTQRLGELQYPLELAQVQAIISALVKIPENLSPHMLLRQSTVPAPAARIHAGLQTEFMGEPCRHNSSGCTCTNLR